jgi:hypothetical protein
MFNVLAFAGEVCSHPVMLRDWVNEFGDDPRISLTICARRGDEAQLHSRLDQACAEFEPGVSSRRQHIREIVAPVASAVEQSLIEGSVAYYSFRRRPAPLSRLPRIGRGDFRALRAICGTFNDACEDPVGPPDFIGVAAQKSGTTWWCELIYRHPRVHRSPRFGKESRFFSTFRGFPPDSVPVEKYASLFPRPAGSIIGEWTPDYLWDPGCAAMLKRAAPKARILVLLRDPVERYISGVTHRVMYREPVGPGAEDMAFEAGLYAKQLATVLEFFPREQMLILQYEQCCLDPVGQIERTYRFLGLDPGFVPEGLTVPVHATHIDKVQVPDETRRQFVEAYRADCARLVELFPDLDLSLWTSLRTEQTESTT